ncbi:MAG TPA: DUF2905 family protein [Bryobacteraceae bacterium]|jgi:hypothetical protein|nr:DUF2905 family protein [Bryobacteraceae bacterium]
MGRILIITGLVLLALGVLFTLGDKLPIKLGRLPGDFEWRGRNTVIYFPLATSIILSLILTLILSLFSRR